MLNERHVKQLEARGLDPELAARLGWESNIRLGGDWISIPYVRRGVVVNHKHRTLAGAKEFTQDANAVKCLWNLDVLADKTLDAHAVVLTEGEMDALAAIQCGFPRTVSVPDGAPAEPLGGADGPKYAYLEEAMGRLKEATIILAVDNDKAGANLFHDLLLRFGRARCKFVTYPFRRTSPGERCKDLNEVLQNWGSKGVVQTLANAQWTALGGVYRMSDLPMLPEVPVMELGYGKPLDDLVKARRGDFWVVSGAPGHGKTALVTDAICRLADRYKLRIAWASFENIPQQDLRRQLRKWHIGKQRLDLSGELYGLWHSEEVQAADAWIDQHFRFMVPQEDEDVTLTWLIERVEAAVVRDGCDGVIIDPWNEVEIEATDLTLTQYVGAAIKAMKRVARKLQVLWIVVAHPAKMKKGDPIDLYAIADSAHWFNKCDIGLLVTRASDDGDAELRCAKAKYEEIGRRGSVKIRLNPETRRFYVPMEVG